MSPMIQWQSAPRLTAIYALRHLPNHGEWVDAQLAKTLSSQSDLVESCKNSETWLALQSGLEPDPEMSIRNVEQSIDRMETSIASMYSQLAEELRLRQEPLRQLWEAHGPGLLLAMIRAAKLELPEQVTVTTVLPLHGGGGEAIREYQNVVFENVLANPVAEVPETLRLAWLIGQLAPEADPDSLVSHCIDAGLDIGVVYQDVSEIARRNWLVS